MPNIPIERIDISLGFTPAADSIRYPHFSHVFGEFYRLIPGAGIFFEQAPGGEFVINAYGAGALPNIVTDAGTF